MLRRPGGSRGLLGHGFPGLSLQKRLSEGKQGAPNRTDYNRVSNVIVEITHTAHACAEWAGLTSVTVSSRE